MEVKVAILDGVEAFPSIWVWLQKNTKSSNGDPTDERHFELQDSCTPPSLIAKFYKSMATYGNHFRATTWLATSSMVTYDSRVMAKFEHTPTNTHDNWNLQLETIHYVRECKKILELDYGFETKVHVLLCFWIQVKAHGLHVAMRKYEWGFTLVHFKWLLPTWEQPFTFASQVEQVFFSKYSTKDPSWKVVITEGARSQRAVDQNVKPKPMEPMATMGEANGPRNYAIKRANEG